MASYDAASSMASSICEANIARHVVDTRFATSFLDTNGIL
jgi:hypothetical protein